MRYYTLVFILCFSILMTGCNSANNSVPTPFHSTSTRDTNAMPSLVSSVVNEIALRELFSLSDNQAIRIHGANGIHIMYEIVETRYLDISTDFRSDSPFPFLLYYATIEIGVVNTESNEIKLRKYFEETTKCTSGATNGESILYSAFEFDPSVPSETAYCAIQLITENDEINIYQVFCDVSLFLTPEIRVLNSGAYIYSYQERILNNDVWFGINTYDNLENREIIRIKNTANDEVLRTVFSCNGNMFAFFCKLNNTGTFIIGNENEITSYMPLRDGEKIDDYCVIEDSLLICISANEETTEWHRVVVVRDFNNEDIVFITSPKDVAYYRMESCGNSIIATTNRFSNYIITPYADGIIITPLNYDGYLDKHNGGKSVGFFKFNDNSCYIYFLESMLLLRIYIDYT
jgi:hypothetical protein